MKHLSIAVSNLWNTCVRFLKSYCSGNAQDMYRVFVTYWLLKFPSRWLQLSHLNSLLSNNWQIKQNKYPAMQPYTHTDTHSKAHPAATLGSSTAKTNNPHYIPIYIQHDTTLHSLFISGNCSTCFKRYLHPLSGANTTVSTASCICHTVTATCRYHGNGTTVPTPPR
jgi:hypothetical protein